MEPPVVRLRNLRIATLNLWNRSEPYAVRMRQACEGITRLAPDILGLQEVFEESASGRRQAHELASREGYHVLSYPAGPLGTGTIGNAVLSRYPIVGGEARTLPHTDGASGRIIVRADIDLPEGPLHFFCTHLSYRADESYKREEQVLAVDGFVRQAKRELPRILVGDFNAEPEATEIRFLTGKATLGGRSTYYQDAAAIVGTEAPTWARRNPYTGVFHEGDRRIDYVFATHARSDGNGEIVSCRLAFDEPDTPQGFASDHFGVIAEIRIGAPRGNR
jgi:endonuclease/exonuclease/phosphatase family metal-dependent hydrolase